jgi:hypothetical protein
MPNTPQPMPSESYEDFVIRAHGELMQYLADPMQRNEVVWDAWEQVYGDTERERATQYFSEDQFVHRYNVPIWYEHEAVIPGPDGQPIVKHNDVNRLKAIVQENNLRIADTDAYTGLVDKHTSPPGQPDKFIEKPKTVGFVGPYRLGMLGRIQPKFAVFADEHHYKEAAQTLKDRPRRSVEVLTLKANGRPYFDPIAALSEAPRLSLPVMYSADSDDGPFLVERYEAMAAAPAQPAYAGGGNTYIPGAGKRKNVQQFDALSTDDSPDDQVTESSSMSLAPEDLKQIADAIMSTPQMQFVQQLMNSQGGQGGSPSPQPGQASAPHAVPPAAPHGGPAPGPQAPAPHAPAAPGAPAQREPYMPAPGGMGMVANRFSAASENLETEEFETVESEQYAALVESNAKLMQRTADLAKSNAMLMARAADADRRVALTQLYQAYPHFVDIKAEEARCLYSAGGNMDDDAFASHLEMLEQYAAKIPAATPMVPGGESERYQAAPRTVERERYEANISEKSVEIYNAAMASGNILTPDQCWAQAEKELSGKA